MYNENKYNEFQFLLFYLFLNKDNQTIRLASSSMF